MSAPDAPLITLPADPDQARSFTLHAVTAVDAEALGAAFAAIAPWSVYPYSAAALGSYLKSATPAAPRYLARCNGTAAGALGLQTDWLRGPYIQFLGILPEFQSHRLGTRLLQWIEADARAKAQRNLWVAASRFNDRARRFYSDFGFVEAAEIPDLVADGVTEILLRKRLG
jgi:ribosomal protein S18 acetylase RimI-like enzyme